MSIADAEGCDDSFINVTDLHTVKAQHFHRRRGEISWPKTVQLNQAVIRALDLDQPA